MNTFSIVCCLFPFLLFSCNKKDSNLSVDQIKNLRVKIITGVAGSAAQGYANNLTYDASGRIVKEEENGQSTAYTYSPGKIIRKVFQGNQTTDVFELELNADGYVRSTKKTGEPAVYTYEYAAGGFLSRYYGNQVPQYEARYYYNLTHTDLLDSIRSTVGGVWNSTATFVYDMEHHNTLQNENIGQKFTGAIHPRPVIKYTYKYDDAGNIKIQVIDYVFTYDTDGRITRKSFVNTGQPLAYTYTYY